MLTHIIGFIKHNFFLPNLTCFSSFFTDVHGLGSGKILSSHSLFFFFHTFLSAALSPSFIFPRSFSYPTSRSPSILAVRSPFLASLMFFHLSLSTLFTSMSASILTMWPAHFSLLLTNLPVELFCCITYFVRSFIFFRQPSLFVLFDKTRTNFQLLCCSVNATVSKYRLRLACVHKLSGLPFQLFQNVSVQHDSLNLSPSISLPVVSGIAFLPLNAHPH